jgi:hypothetical protein
MQKMQKNATSTQIFWKAKNAKKMQNASCIFCPSLLGIRQRRHPCQATPGPEPWPGQNKKQLQMTNV